MSFEKMQAQIDRQATIIWELVICNLILMAVCVGLAIGFGSVRDAAAEAQAAASREEQPVVDALPENVTFPAEDEKPVLRDSDGNTAVHSVVHMEDVAEDIVEEKLEGTLMTVKATAYCPCVKCCGKWSAEHPSRIGTDFVQKTATGTIPTEGRTIAVDPKVIPYGSTVILNGNEYKAEDCGGGIDGKQIDIFYESHQAALEWGVQNVDIEVILEG